jgi:hypothetical protein
MQRKFITILVSLALVCPFVASAQALFGLKGGLNVSTIGGNASGNSSKIGLHLGVFMDGKISDKVHFQPELLYSSQGSLIAINSDELRFNYNYMSVPLMLKIYLESGFHIQAGPQIAFLIDANATDGRNSMSVKNQMNGTDFSVCLGMGYEFEGGFLLNARYNIGLNSTTNNPATANQSFPNRVFQLSLGYIFGK